MWIFKNFPVPVTITTGPIIKELHQAVDGGWRVQWQGQPGVIAFLSGIETDQ